MGNNDARVHSGRTDCNGRPRGTRRRASLHWSPSPQEDWVANEAAGFTNAQFIAAYYSAPEAGDQSLDGLHPGHEGQEA